MKRGPGWYSCSGRYATRAGCDSCTGIGASLSAPLRFQHPRCRCQALWGGRRGEALLKVRACSEQAARLASIYCTSHMCRSRRSHMIAATRRRQRWQQKEKRRCLSIHVEVMISEPSASASDDNKEFYWYTTVGRQHGMSYARLTNPYFMPGGCFCAHRCCLESVMHARNRVSCVPSELGSTTVMVNYKCSCSIARPDASSSSARARPATAARTPFRGGALPGAVRQRQWQLCKVA